ncbi:MAG: TrkH family potassium uptake protein [Pseudomonadales bacterium]|nr:TrkH family potassium uptake protein [Pseudomonadales bacterium]MCP5182340.1 TrkH family potassium uptake protein [Pseudomonadales bacterium]
MALLLAIVAGWGAANGDTETLSFAISAAGVLGAGLILATTFRAPGFNLVARQLYLLTGSAWVTLALAGAVPMTFSTCSLADAFFESMSGITTTGSTVLTGLDRLPRTILLWRSILQWLGGLGVVGMAVSILPFLQVGGMRLFHTESSDWSDKSMPRIQTLARMIGITYLGLTLACASGYWLTGMTPFDALNHAMTTVSTGGYATSDQSMARFDLPVLWVAIVFMVLGSLPFTSIIAIVRRPRLVFAPNQQIVGLLVLLLVAMMLLTLHLALRKHGTPFADFTHATFNLVSVVSTTGYASDDYTQWSEFSVVIFFIAMFIGGCSGSSSGGMKIFRFQLGYLFLRNQIQRLIHPNGVFVTQYNHYPVPEDIVISAVAFCFLFFASVAAVSLLLGLMGLDLITAISAASTSLTNVGPGFGEIIGPAGNFATLPVGAKWLLAFAMLLGRLELLTIMVLFTPMFWRG